MFNQLIFLNYMELESLLFLPPMSSLGFQGIPGVLCSASGIQPSLFESLWIKELEGRKLICSSLDFKWQWQINYSPVPISKKEPFWKKKMPFQTLTIPFINFEIVYLFSWKGNAIIKLHKTMNSQFNWF